MRSTESIPREPGLAADLFGLAAHRPERPDRGLLRARHQVAVEIHGHPYRLVAHYLLDDRRRPAPLIEGDRGEGVPELVQGKPGQPRGGEVRLQVTVAQVVAVHRRAHRRGEDEV